MITLKQIKLKILLKRKKINKILFSKSFSHKIIKNRTFKLFGNKINARARKFRKFKVLMIIIKREFVTLRVRV